MDLIVLRTNQLDSFKKEMQEAFQKGYEDRFGPAEGLILPDADIQESLDTPSAVAFEVVEGNERLGGAIVAFSVDGKHGDLHFLYTKTGLQNRGVARFAWNTIESLYPNVTVWETCTPYFDVRNIHFYVNRCGFHIVEFFNEHHPNELYSNTQGVNSEGEDGFFRFEKVILPF